MKKYTFSIDCPVRGGQCISATSKIVTSKWTPQILFAIAHGVQRFCEIQDAVGGVNPRTLSVRLDGLQEQGIISKLAFAEVPPRIEYSLTQKGHDLLPIIDHMLQWGERYEVAVEPEPAAAMQ